MTSSINNIFTAIGFAAIGVLSYIWCIVYLVFISAVPAIIIGLTWFYTGLEAFGGQGRDIRVFCARIQHNVGSSQCLDAEMRELRGLIGPIFVFCFVCFYIIWACQYTFFKRNHHISPTIECRA